MIGCTALPLRRCSRRSVLALATPPLADGTALPHIIAMQEERFSETVTERNQRRDAEINEAVQRNIERHKPAAKNTHRLHALRLEPEKSAAPNGPSPINEPPPPIDDPPKPPQPDEPPKPPPVNDPPPEEKPPPMRAALGSARH